MTQSSRESDSAKYNRVLKAMSGAGAVYVGSAASRSQMVVTSELLGDSPLKSLLQTYLCEDTPLAGVLAGANGGFTVFWSRRVDTDSLGDALGADTQHLVWDAAGHFTPDADAWPADYVFGQFLLLVNLGQIKLPVDKGKVFCPFCGEHHEPTGDQTQCPRLNDDFARFSVAPALH